MGTGAEPEEVLRGGVANAGRVSRVGTHVLRPATTHTPSIHAFLAHLAAAGFAGAPRPAGVADDGRERLTYLPGEVALPPYPAWLQEDGALASIARLLRAFHDAAGPFDASGSHFSGDMADPEGGRLVCHNDLCPENVVFEGGRAVGMLDFDFAAPGRPEYDLAQCARMCVPVDDDESAALLGWFPADRPARLRLVSDAYGLERLQRSTLLGALDASIVAGGAFIRRRVAAGEPNFIALWAAMGGDERFDRRRRWWATARPRFARSLA